MEELRLKKGFNAISPEAIRNCLYFASAKELKAFSRRETWERFVFTLPFVSVIRRNRPSVVDLEENQKKPEGCF